MNALPLALTRAIEAELTQYPAGELSRAAAAISARYRNPTAPERAASPVAFLQTAGERAAYAATRMPATYAAVAEALRRLGNVISPASLKSLLDLGAGTGAALWAAATTLPELAQARLLERDAGMIALGRRLASVANQYVVRTATWQQAEMSSLREFPTADLVTCSYALNELSAVSVASLVSQAWRAAGKVLLLVEPGTMRAFTRLLEVRQQLIEEGGHLLAPCPHAFVCPLPANDWCHFSIRLARNLWHQRQKGGMRSYEDEKFFYLIFAKSAWLDETSLSPQVTARILRHPYKQAGRIELSLCHASGALRSITLKKHDVELWRAARKVAWGDEWPNLKSHV